MAYNKEIDEEIYEKLLGNFELLCNIIRQNKGDDQLKVDLSKIEAIINKEIPDALGKNAPEDFYELYTDFKSEYEKFRDFILYDRLIGKNIVALGGGFSSGKSSFLNALMGKNVLPADIDPSTSVPTYIVRGEKHEVMGINVFDTKVSMQPKDIRKIAHGFGELEDDDFEKVTDEVTLGHVLENIFFSTPWHKYDNIAFLDTPGYSKPDSEKYSAKTDEKIARGQLNSSNYILWFVQADAGTITEEDIKFIKTIREDIPKLIIVNKADKKNVRDLKDIIEKIKTTLSLKGVRYVDVCAFTSKMEQVGDDELRAFIEADTEKIKNQLKKWNSRVYESYFARNFKRLFVRCKEFYEDEIEVESRKLKRLNTSITRLLGEDIDADILEPLQMLVKNVQGNVNELKNVCQELKNLQDEFFTEIKRISDQVGIAMPEPSEIDLLREGGQDPLELLINYRQAKGINKDKGLEVMLQDLFQGINLVSDKKQGGGVYPKELLEKQCDRLYNDVKLHSIRNESLMEESDFIIETYLKMLSVVLLETQSVTEAQVALFVRMMKGVEAENGVNYYLRSALQVDGEEIIRFIEEIKGRLLKYRFMLDVMILAASGNKDKSQMVLVAEFADLLVISGTTLRSLAYLAKSVCYSDEDDFLDALLSMQGYISRSMLNGFFDMQISDDCIIHHENTIFQSRQKNNMTARQLEQIKEASTDCIKIANYKIDMSIVDLSKKPFLFSHKNRVEFVDCEFVGGKKQPILFHECEEILINKCIFRDFCKYTMSLIRVNSLTLKYSEFVHCEQKEGYLNDYQESKYISPPDGYRFGLMKHYDLYDSGCGGILRIRDKKCEVYIENCIFDSCGLNLSYARSNYYVIANTECEVHESTFRNCGHCRGAYRGYWDHSEKLFPYGSHKVGCKFENSADFV